jgi:hypothetical protein
MLRAIFVVSSLKQWPPACSARVKRRPDQRVMGYDLACCGFIAFGMTSLSA